MAGRFGVRRKEILAGKAMVVCMSQRICVELYDEIVKLRPDWHSNEDGKGRIKVMTPTAASWTGSTYD